MGTEQLHERSGVQKMMALLEDCEFNSDREKTRSIPKIVIGAIIGVIGISAAVYAIGWLDADGSSLQRSVLLTSGSLFVVIAMFLSISGLSDRQFRAVNIKIQRYGTWAAAAFQTVMLLLILASALVLVPTVAKHGILETNLYILVPLTVVIMFLTYGIYELGSGPISIGITAIRRRFNCRRYSAVLETCAFGVILICFMVAMASTGESPMSLALGVLLALISYFSFKMKILDDAFNETFKLFHSVRNDSWRSYLAECAIESASDGDAVREAKYGMMNSYRDLLRSMHRTPVFSRRPVSFFGIYVLCQLADAREMGAGGVGWIFNEGRRAHRAREVLKMSDEEFALASAILFDALGTMVTARKNQSPGKKHRRRHRGVHEGELRKKDDTDLETAINASFIHSIR